MPTTTIPSISGRTSSKYRLEGNEAKGNVAVRAVQYSPDLVIREALDFLDRHKAGPFCLFLTSTLPHANNERGRAEGNGMEVPSDAPYSAEPWPQVEKNHAAMITRLDGDVGRVLRRLKDLGLEDDTIVFFSSDNGPHKEGGADPAFFRSSGPLRGYKRAMYEGGIRVPMIVRWPGKVAAGTVSDPVWAFWDVLPTLAELAGAPIPAGHRWHLAGSRHPARESSTPRIPLLGVPRRRVQAGGPDRRLESGPARTRQTSGALQPQERHWRDTQRGQGASRGCRTDRGVSPVVSNRFTRLSDPNGKTMRPGSELHPLERLDANP